MFFGLSIVFIEMGDVILEDYGGCLISDTKDDRIMWINNVIRAILDPFRRKDDSIFGDVAKEINQDLKQQGKRWIKASDFERMFREFKESEIYAKVVLYLISGDKDDAPNWDEFRKKTYGQFIDFRLYLHTVAPNIVETDIDYCILILAGFRQMDLYKLLNISPSGIRNIKPRLKDKIPSYLYNNIFNVNHCIY